MRPVIALFDIDGVLVQPRGYRKGIEETFRHFLGKMGLLHLLPGEALPVLYESFGVTSEWDMLPITLAVILEAAFGVLQGKPGRESLEEACELVRGKGMSDLDVDLKTEIEHISPYFKGNSVPAEALLMAVQRGEISLFPQLKDSLLLEELLAYTRDVRLSPVTRYFQNLVLGGANFRQVYGLQPEVAGEPFLGTYDKLLVSPESLSRLKQLSRRGALFCAAMTARPSLPPAGIAGHMYGYSPEAEQAIALLDDETFPLIGYGSVGYLAERLGVSADDLLKPAPVQALAAVAAAWQKHVWAALVWAARHYASCSGALFSAAPLAAEGVLEAALPKRFTLHVFEDSSIGVTACRNAVDVLAADGYDVDLYAWGITHEPKKIAALEAVGADVYPHVDAAIAAALF